MVLFCDVMTSPVATNLWYSSVILFLSTVKSSKQAALISFDGKVSGDKA
jgi:hypothetical protein